MTRLSVALSVAPRGSSPAVGAPRRLALRLVCLAALAAAVLSIPGCGLFDSFEPRTVSPVSGRKVTASELAAEAVKFDAEQRAEEARAAEAERAKLRALRAQAEIKARTVAAGAEAELLKLQAETELGAQEVVGAAAADRAARDAAIAAMQERVDLAAGDLARQHQQRAAAWSAVKLIPGVTGVPGFAAADQLVTGLISAGVAGGAVQLTKGRIKRRAAAAAEEHAGTLTAARKIVDSLDMLRIRVPALDQALKDPAITREIDEWQGADGKALVDALQKGEAPVAARRLPLVLAAAAPRAAA